MAPIDSVLIQYETGRQLRLTKIKALNTFYFLLKMMAIVASASVVFAFFRANLASSTTFFFVGATTVLFVVIFFIRRYCNALSIKGDTLILTDIRRKHVVTSIRSIKKLKNFRFSRFSITKMIYNLDGIDRKVILVKLLSANEIEPITVIKTILKKQKANL